MSGDTRHQRIGVEISYFDEHSVDIILTPSQYQDSGTYKVTSLHTRAFSFQAWILQCCSILSPSLSQPFIVSCHLRGLGLGVNDDDYARTHDLEWLHKVGTVVEALHANGSGLQRVEPPCNADLIPSP